MYKTILLFLSIVSASEAAQVYAKVTWINRSNGGVNVALYGQDEELTTGYYQASEIIPGNHTVSRVYAWDPQYFRYVQLVKEASSTASLQGASFVNGAYGVAIDVNPDGLIIVGELGSPGYSEESAPVFTFIVENDMLPDARKTVWRLGDTELTGDVYREGVDKIIDAVRFGSPGSAGAGGGGEPVPGGDTTNSEMIAGAQIDALSKVNDLGDVAATSVSDITAAGLNAASEVALLYAGMAAPTELGFTVSGGSAPIFAVVDPFSGATYDFNPFSSERMGTVVAWFRSATAWLVVVLLGIWVWNELDSKGAGMGVMQQAKGNPMVGGTGAQATAATNAGLMTVAIITLTVALLAWSFGSVSFAGIYANMGVDPLSTLPGGVMFMLDTVFPVSTILTCLVAKLSWKLYSVPLYAVCVATVRWFVL